jgi:glutamine amidotransferase PdxT
MEFPVCVGVLALQGSYREHMTCLRKTGVQTVVEVRPLSDWSKAFAMQRNERVRYFFTFVVVWDFFRVNLTDIVRCLSCCQIKKPHQLEGIDGLIIPGGESTTMALVAHRWGLVRLSPP